MQPTRELKLVAGDGTRLFTTDWLVDAPIGKRRGVVMMHGLGEHCGRYAHVARFFNACGWSVRAYDHRGHGRSDGPRGDTPDVDTILRDARVVIDNFAREIDAPPLLLGHSMGGLFAACYATAAPSPLSGLILSSPALAIQLSDTQKFLLKTLGAIAPGLGVPNGLQTCFLSHDPAVEAAYKADPLVHSKITPRLLRSMLAAIEHVHAHAAEVAVPVLMVVAGDDRLVDASGSDAFFAGLKPGIGTIHRYPGLYHELFNERDAARVFDDVRQWLDAKQFNIEQGESASATA